MGSAGLFKVDLQQSSPNEFAQHPDFRQIATFFLGWTFFAALRYLLDSHLVQSICHRILPSISFFGAGEPTGEPSTRWSEKMERWPADDSSSRLPLAGRVSIDLVFVLTLCIALASLAQFVSFLAFNPGKGDTACAFVTAWSGMAGQSARIVGLLKITFDMRAMGTSLWESVALWAWLAVGLIFIFATNAINIGTIQLISQLDGLAFCYRRRLLPVSLVASLIYIVTESYLLVRLMMLLAPRFLKLRHRVSSLHDVRFGRVVSLLMLDVMTITPQAVVVSVLAEAIPFALGSLIVLYAFNYEPRAIPQQGTCSIPPTSHGSAGVLSSVRLDDVGSSPRRSPQSSLQFSIPAGRHNSTTLSVPRHPYATSESVHTPQFSIHTIETSDSETRDPGAGSGVFPQSVRVSTMTTDSALAQSVKEAKISFVFRNGPNAGQSKDEQRTELRSQQLGSVAVSDSPLSATQRHGVGTRQPQKPPPLVLRRYNPRLTSGLPDSNRTISESSDTVETHNGHTTTSSEDRHTLSPYVISPNDRRDSNAPAPTTRIGAPSPIEDIGIQGLPSGTPREKRSTFGEAVVSSPVRELQELPPLPFQVQEVVVPNLLGSGSSTNTRSPSAPSTPRPKGPRPRKPSGGPNF